MIKVSKYKYLATILVIGNILAFGIPVFFLNYFNEGGFLQDLVPSVIGSIAWVAVLNYVIYDGIKKGKIDIKRYKKENYNLNKILLESAKFLIIMVLVVIFIWYLAVH